MSIAVEFSEVSRQYGSVTAVNRVSFQIAEGEFFSMLGPSGSGKTTCLRMMAGFEHPSLGDIKLFGLSSTDIPPYERAVNTVFQDYALFPHMSVLENVAYGLTVKGTAKKEASQRAEEALAMVALSGYGARKPSALSGGQRQRVALARALVNRPKILLLDEPLGALDLKLREHMQTELKQLHQQLGITFIYVTHDQTEALSMSDRIAVFNHGKIEQLDTPQNIYHAPKTAFVASFVGTANVFPAAVASYITGHAQGFSIRPEHIAICNAASAASDDFIQVVGVVSDIQFQGANTKIEITLSENVAPNRLNNGKPYTLNMVLSNAWQASAALPKLNESISLQWAKERMVWLSENTV